MTKRAPIRTRPRRGLARLPERAVAGTVAPEPAGPDGRWGVVVALYGRYVAGRIDLLTRDRFKSLEPITASPFTVAGEADPGLKGLAGSERSTGRSDAEVRKDLGSRLAGAGADVLVVDNSAAVLRLRELNGRFYTVVRGEESDLMDAVWNDATDEERAASFRPAGRGLTDELREAYDAFIDACLGAFDASRIILVRTHSASFWVAEDGRLGRTDADRRTAEFLDELDAYFVERTGCRVSEAALAQFPRDPKWHSMGSEQRVAIEDDVVRLVTGALRSDPPEPTVVVRGSGEAAGHVVRAVARDSPVRRKWLRRYFARGGASYDDLLALAFLQQERPGQHEQLIRACVRHAVADPTSRPLARTRQRFESSLGTLRQWEWCSVRIPAGDQWAPQIVVGCGEHTVRFLADGSIEWLTSPEIRAAEVAGLATGDVPITLSRLRDVVASWPVYLERGRRRITAAPQVLVADAQALVDSCFWLDWDAVLASETVVVTRRPRRTSRIPEARTDLSFIFDARTRIGTVGGGLMDQVTHIALFDELCSAHGLDLYLDDFRYTWWRSHNGFEASRLAPELEARRMTRRVSPALLESFRTEVRRSRLPWVFSQSLAWQSLGLTEAFVVTRDYFNARRLEEMDAGFPYLIYPDDADLAKHIEHPPSPVTFFTTQHRIAISPASAGPLGRIFSYRHLAGDRLPATVAETSAALRETPHVAFHVRRGDYMNAHFDQDGWFSKQEQYVSAIQFLIDSELGTSDFDVAVFSDDMEFVRAHAADYGLDLVTGQVRFVSGNRHYDSIFDSAMMALCPVIVGSVGFFAATTSLLADPPSVFIRTRPDAVWVAWRREA